MVGKTCGRGICNYGEDCCMTCDENGKMIESGECESTLNGNPGCPMVICLPEGKSLTITISYSKGCND